MVENKGINAHSNQRIVTVEDNLNNKLDGLKNDFEHKWDNLQDSTEDLIDQQQCPLEEECQSDTMAEEQCQQQPHQELIKDFIELSEGLSESSDMCDVVFPRENQEEILPFITQYGRSRWATDWLLKKKSISEHYRYSPAGLLIGVTHQYNCSHYYYFDPYWYIVCLFLYRLKPLKLT